MKPENIKAFNALLKRYESITFEEIKRQWDYNFSSYPWVDAGDVARDLTGFGSIEACTLCTAIEGNQLAETNVDFKHWICPKCVYYRKRKDTMMFCCNTGKSRDTYQGIDEAHTPEELLEAFRNRAKYLRKKYSQYVEIQSSENSVS